MTFRPMSYPRTSSFRFPYRRRYIPDSSSDLLYGSPVFPTVPPAKRRTRPSLFLPRQPYPMYGSFPNMCFLCAYSNPTIPLSPRRNKARCRLRRLCRSRIRHMPLRSQRRNPPRSHPRCHSRRSCFRSIRAIYLHSHNPEVRNRPILFSVPRHAHTPFPLSAYTCFLPRSWSSSPLKRFC